MTPFQEIYNQFISQRGDLFESSEIDLDESDIKELERLHSFSRKITYPLFLTVGILGMAGGLYVLFYSIWYIGLGICVASFSIGAFSFYYKSYYGELIKNGKKQLVIGIITRIRNSGSYHIGITLSQKTEMFFPKEKVKGFSLGEIIRCEKMSKIEDHNMKIERLGTIHDYLKS